MAPGGTAAAPRTAASQRRGAALHTAAALWWSGFVDALQLQRCVVFCVLDSSGVILAKIGKCFLVNGGVYLGSLLLYTHALAPASSWLLARYAAPAYGDAAAGAWLRALQLLLHAVWLAPVYVISLIVSCIWYQQMAVAAFHVRQQQQQQQQPTSSGATQAQQPAALPPAAAAARSPSPGPSGSSSGSGGPAAALEGVASEVYRVLFFLVYSMEVLALSLVPHAGFLVNVVFLSWLYAYYCFDYAWGLQGVPLPQRLQFVERRWAFFAGFGLPCVLPTLLLPYPANAALLNLLFPVFVLVACGSDPEAKHERLGWRPADMGRLPVFGMALRPTAALVGLLMRRVVVRGSAR